MRKTKLFVGVLLFITTFFLQSFNINERKNRLVVYDKEPIDCGTYFGTKCVGRGDGCDPTPCDDGGLGTPKK